LSIQKAQEAFNNPVVAQNLAYIQSNFSVLPHTIEKLETQGLKLTEALGIFAKIEHDVTTADGELGQQIRSKFSIVVQNNPGLAQMIDIAKVLTGDCGQREIELAPNEIAAMKFAPLTSCDVERSFSIYKNILADNRTSFTPENLEKYIVCNCEKRN
jgi:hypothetical protein